MTIYAGQATLLLEPIAPLEELEREADKRDMDSVAEFSSPSRRAERLAWRRVMRRIAPDVEVEYDASGAPYIKPSSTSADGSNIPYTHISVSHCRDVVAVALSNVRCGVDVERLNRNFERVAERYITSEERQLCLEEWWLAAVWCAKETLYKIAGREGVDFRHDMTIEALDTTSHTIHCRGVEGERVELRYLMPDEEHIVVYLL